MGYIAKQDSTDFKTFKTALLYGTVMASFACEEFSFDRTINLSQTEIESRFEEMKSLISLD